MREDMADLPADLRLILVRKRKTSARVRFPRFAHGLARIHPAAGAVGAGGRRRRAGQAASRPSPRRLAARLRNPAGVGYRQPQGRSRIARHGANPGEPLAAAGARGVVVNAGHVEAQPDAEIYPARFESEADGPLSQPIGCLAEELSYHPPTP